MSIYDATRTQDGRTYFSMKWGFTNHAEISLPLTQGVLNRTLAAVAKAVGGKVVKDPSKEFSSRWDGYGLLGLIKFEGFYITFFFGWPRLRMVEYKVRDGQAPIKTIVSYSGRDRFDLFCWKGDRQCPKENQVVVIAPKLPPVEKLIEMATAMKAAAEKDFAQRKQARDETTAKQNAQHTLREKLFKTGGNDLFRRRESIYGDSHEFQSDLGFTGSLGVNHDSRINIDFNTDDPALAVKLIEFLKTLKA